MKEDNRGLSLVELVVTVAIMVVVVSVGILGIGFLSPREAKKTCDNLKLTFDNARTDALSKQSMELYIWKDSDGVHYKKVVTINLNTYEDTRIIGKSNVKVQLEKTDGTLVDIGDTEATGAKFTYKRGTGGFDTMSPFEISKIHVSKGSATYTLVLQKYTGKIIVE